MSFIRKIKRNGKIYLAEVENSRVDGKVVQRHIRYLGLDPESKSEPISFYNKDVKVESVKVYGPVIVLESIAKELGLFDLLGDIAHPILSLVFAHCLDYKSVVEVEKWFEKTDLSTMFECEEITRNNLYNAVEKLSKFNFEHIEKSIFEKLTQLFGDDDSGVIYDGTNTYLNGSLSQLAKQGKDKEGVRGRNLIQIGLGVTRKLGLPIFHQVHAGNIHDTKMFQEAIFKFNSMGVKKGLAVFDRGITSSECISRLSKSGWKSLAGLQGHAGVKKKISNLDFSKIKNFKNLVIQGDTKFFVSAIPFEMGSEKGKLLILQNYLKKQKLSVERMVLVEEAKELFKNNPDDVSDEVKIFLKKDGGINSHAIERAEKFDGLSFIFTNAKLNHKEVISSYFAKDLVERCFRVSKSVLKLRPIRFILDDRIKTHVMICYIALALLTTLRIRMEKEGVFRDSGAVLRDLESVYKIYFSGKEKKSKQETLFFKVNTMTNAQKKIIGIIAPKLDL